MTDIRYINVEHEGSQNTLAVSAGLSASELEAVIQSVFRVNGTVVGFQAMVSHSPPRC